MRSRLLLCALLLALVGCVSTPVALRDASRSSSDAELKLPRQGEVLLDSRVFYGIPILQKSFFWDGNGEDDVAGVKVRELWHATDSFAIGSGLTASNWFLSGEDAQAAEFEAVGRYLFHREPDESAAWFFELTGGYQYATDRIPDGGTAWNWTFSFGPGVLVPMAPNVDFEAGVTYHHVSNALGRDNDRNPSQNEAQAWVGFALRF